MECIGKDAQKTSKKTCFLLQHSGIAFFKVIAYNKVRNKQENKKKIKGG